MLVPLTQPWLHKSKEKRVVRAGGVSQVARGTFNFVSGAICRVVHWVLLPLIIQVACAVF